MSVEQWWNDTDRGKLKYWERNCSIATISAKNTTWIDLGLKLYLCIDRPACNYPTGRQRDRERERERERVTSQKGEVHLLIRRFPGFARSSFWSE